MYRLTAALVRLETAWSARPQVNRWATWRVSRPIGSDRARAASSPLPAAAWGAAVTTWSAPVTSGWLPQQRGVAPAAQVLVERPGVEQFPHPAQPGKPRRGEVVIGQPVLAVGGEQLGDALPDGPAHLHVRERVVQLREVSAVVAQVRAGALGEGQLGAGDGLADHLGHVADLHVVLGAADVERLIVDDRAGGGEHGREGPADVLDVHEGTPRGAVALQVDLARGQRDGGEVIHHDVQRSEE